MGGANEFGRIRADPPGAFASGQRSKMEIVLDSGKASDRRSRVVLPHAYNQRIARAEDGVGVDVLIAIDIESRHSFAIAGALIRKWMCEGRQPWRACARIISPTGPSKGIL